jgi:hypothetical protein
VCNPGPPPACRRPTEGPPRRPRGIGFVRAGFAPPRAGSRPPGLASFARRRPALRSLQSPRFDARPDWLRSRRVRETIAPRTAQREEQQDLEAIASGAEIGFVRARPARDPTSSRLPVAARRIGFVRAPFRARTVDPTPGAAGRIGFVRAAFHAVRSAIDLSKSPPSPPGRRREAADCEADPTACVPGLTEAGYKRKRPPAQTSPRPRATPNRPRRADIVRIRATAAPGDGSGRFRRVGSVKDTTPNAPPAPKRRGPSLDSKLEGRIALGPRRPAEISPRPT